jgi:uncharacterized protein YhaN
MMAVTDDARRDLFRRLNEVLGDGHAVTLMDQFPPAGADVLTRDHLDVALAAQTARMEQRFAEMEQRFGRIDQRFAEMEQRFAEMEQRFAEMEQRFAEMEQRFAGVDGRISGQTRVMSLAIVGAVIGSNLTTATIAFAAAGLM